LDTAAAAAAAAAAFDDWLVEQFDDIFFLDCRVVFVLSETFLRPPTESAFSQ